MSDTLPNQAITYNVPVDNSHPYTTVLTTEQKTIGGAHTFYTIRTKEGSWLGDIKFQDGPILQSGLNGIMNENLLAIVIDRLEGFQAGPYACYENAQALDGLRSALEVLKSRTAARQERGVEGTSKI